MAGWCEQLRRRLSQLQLLFMLWKRLMCCCSLASNAGTSSWHAEGGKQAGCTARSFRPAPDQRPQSQPICMYMEGESTACTCLGLPGLPSPCQARAWNWARTCSVMAGQRGAGVRGGEGGPPGGVAPWSLALCSSHMGARDSTILTSGPASFRERRSSCSSTPSVGLPGVLPRWGPAAAVHAAAAACCPSGAVRQGELAQRLMCCSLFGWRQQGVWPLRACA